MGTYPAFSVEFAPGISASAAPAAPDWVDISHRVTADWSDKWGRWSEFSESGAGTGSLTIANDDGEFDPDNSSGTYYGDLVAGTWFRIKGGTTAANTDVFYGHVSDDGFQVAASQHPNLYVRVDLVDDLEQLANTDMPGSVYVIEVEADTPDAWWRLGESNGTTATDSSGNGHHGTYEGGATFGSATGLIYGDADNAIGWDPDYRVSVPQVLTDFGFTVEAWVDIAESLANDGTIWSQQTGDVSASGLYSQAFLGYTAMGAEPYLRVSVTATAATPAAYREMSSALSAGVHHVVAVFPAAGASTPAELKLFVDGVAVTGTSGGTSATMPAFPAAMTQTTIGNQGGEAVPSAGDFSGVLDEVALYSSVLSDARIAAHHTAGAEPWASELSGARIDHLLDAVSYDATLRDIDAGVSTVQAAALRGGDAASAVREVAKTEGGFVFVNHQDAGKVKFVGRQARWTESASLTSQATFGDGGGSEVPYDAIQLVDDRIINRATVQRSNGAAVTVSDSVSEAARRRTFGESGLLYETDAESQYRAERIVAEKKDRHRVPKTITLKPRASTHPAWAQVFARKVDDRITVKWRPSYGGTQTFTCWIDGIGHKWDSATGLTTTFSLSPVPFDTTAEPYWIAGTSTAGVTTRPGY